MQLLLARILGESKGESLSWSTLIRFLVTSIESAHLRLLTEYRRQSYILSMHQRFEAFSSCDTMSALSDGWCLERFS